MSANSPRLSVVIPVCNEQNWIDRCVDALIASARAADWPIELIVVDDGSTDDTPEKLAALGKLPDITVLSQPNAGRFAARAAGMAKASGDWVMLLDSRVIVDIGSLSFLQDQLKESPDRVVWNGHIEVASEHNPYAGFMAGLVKIGWRRYFSDPRLTSFGIDDFDRYPKGTTLFCAPKSLLEASVAAFSSLFEDTRLASDDTRMLRWIAERQRIHLSPEFSATYHGRDSLKKFAAQSFFRGTTYVDSYLTSPGPARNAMFGALVAGAAGLGFAAKRPKTALAASALGAVAAGAAVKKCGATTAEARAVTTLLPLFSAGFAAGLLRGLFLAFRSRSRRGRESRP